MATSIEYEGEIMLLQHNFNCVLQAVIIYYIQSVMMSLLYTVICIIFDVSTVKSELYLENDDATTTKSE